MVGAATSIIFCRNTCLSYLLSRSKYACRDRRLSRRNYVCRDKRFLLRQNVWHDKYLSRKTYFCGYKHTFVATNTCLSRQNTSLVATKVFLSRQNSRQIFVCRDKSFVARKLCQSSQAYLCRNKHIFVATKDVFCRDKHMFVATKMTLVASPANDTPRVFSLQLGLFGICFLAVNLSAGKAQ